MTTQSARVSHYAAISMSSQVSMTVAVERSQ